MENFNTEKQRSREGWRTVKLGDAITDMAAGPFGSNLKVECFVPSGFPIIDGANLKEFKVTDNITKFVTEEKARSLHRSIAKRGDIVVTISGTVGQISYIPNTSKYSEYLCSQRQFRATIDSSQIDVRYLVYYFHSFEGQHKILAFANQVGVPALSQPLKNFREIILTLPPLATQRRIAAVLGALDDKIELNRKMNANLEAQAQALFKSWFVDFEPWGGVRPKEWREGTVGEVADVVGGGTPSKAKSEYFTDKGIAWLTPKDLSISHAKFTDRGAIDITDVGYRNSGAKMMPKGSVLFSSRAPIGYLTIALNDICTNQGFKSLVPKRLGTAYLYYYLKEKTPTIQLMSTGSTFKEASGSLMKTLDILVPDEKTASDFEALMKHIFSRQELLESESRKLAELRDALLPKLMSGELEVA